MGAYLADRAASCGGGGRQAHEEHELLPDRAGNVIAQVRVDAGLHAGIMEALHSLGPSTAVLAEHELLHCSGVADDTRLGDRGCDVAHAAGHGLRAEFGDEHVVLDDAVLERNHRRVAADERLNGPSRNLGVPQFDAEEHEIDRTDVAWRVGDLRVRQVHVAEGAGDLQAMTLHRSQVRPSCDEAHVAASQGKLGPEIAAHTARAHDRELHASPLAE